MFIILVDIQQDSTTSFTCKTYFAHEFDTLRASLIATNSCSGHSPNASPNKVEASAAASATAESADGESTDTEHKRKVSNTLLSAAAAPTADDVDEVRVLFARSLCSSVMWDARGGKSGSKFCKTKGKL